MKLAEIVRTKIQKEGPISFRDFMEICLYHPELGYYNSEIEKIGSTGDYFTSPTFSPVFGELLGKQLEEMWLLLGRKPFTIVEYGAGTGALCYSLMNYLKNNKPLYEELRYCIIEKSVSMRKKEKTILNKKVSWHNSISDISEINGCILSNELIDNFAVHRVVMKTELMEIFVDYENDFIERLKPAKNELVNYMKELRVELQYGFRAEINIEATEWIKEVAENLKSGYVLTIDYGYPSCELYYDYESCDTLMCYKKHRCNKQPFRNIGMQDITTHVNFSALCLWGYKNGLDYCGFTDQSRFLSSLGFWEYLKKIEIPGQDYQNFKKELILTQTLMKDMGDKFKVLIQQKNLPKYKLMGLPN